MASAIFYLCQDFFLPEEIENKIKNHDEPEEIISLLQAQLT